MPTILVICQNPALGETRRVLLEGDGYHVLVVTDVRELEQIRAHLDCAVLGRDIEPRMKRAVAGLLEKQWPGIPILEIDELHAEIEGAACVPSGAPEEVLEALDDLLRPTGRRYSQHLHQKTLGVLARARDAIHRSEELAITIAGRAEKSTRQRWKNRPKEKGK